MSQPVQVSQDEWRTELVGRWSPARPFEVTRERLVAYARATGDDIAPHAAGELAPPVFATVPTLDVMRPVVLEVLPAELAGRIVHGDQDFHFHRPITPGLTLDSTCAVIGVRAKSSGTTLVVKIDSRDADSGELVCEQHKTLFVRGAENVRSTGDDAPPHPMPAHLRDVVPIAEQSRRIDDATPARYAEASGDHNPIHLEDVFARGVGLPGRIVHGLCTMAFASQAVCDSACFGDPRRLQRLAGRFARPVRPGQEITTRVWPVGAGTYAFETTDENGTVVIRDGWAEVSR